MRASDYTGNQPLTHLSKEWLAHIRAQVAPRNHLQLVSERSALLVIDMIRYFADPRGRAYLPAATPIVGQIRTLTEAWHRMKRPVIFTRHCHRDEGDLGMLGKFFSDYIRAGEPDAEIIEPLAPETGDVVLQKNTYDAFYNTRLETILKERRVEQVVITGVLTHMCCETTARSAFCRGFEVYVPVDAVASTTRERHMGSLLSLADAVAVMMNTQEVMDRCAEPQ